MVNVCLYFQVHQPYRLRKYQVFEVGKNHDYFDEKKNREIIEKVAKKCYIPANSLLLDMIKRHNGKFKVSFSITGMALEQFERYAPEVLEGFKRLAKTGCVEFLAETYYHSLASLYSEREFYEQVELHRKTIKRLFNKSPEVFRNTELIYNNDLGEAMYRRGFKGVLAEGADKLLGWKSPDHVYNVPENREMKILLKNYKLSDDIAFRFSNKEWSEYPLTVEKYVKWLNALEGNSDVVNIFMDYETIGEHQWADTGIFRFFDALPKEFLSKEGNRFLTVSEALAFESKGSFDSPEFISWADTERDITAWTGNKMQQEALKTLYNMEKEVKENRNENLLENWRRLQISDNFYYMSTKFFGDGDVHDYFSPYSSPYESFIAFMNVMNDMSHMLKKEEKEIVIEQDI